MQTKFTTWLGQQRLLDAACALSEYGIPKFLDVVCKGVDRLEADQCVESESVFKLGIEKRCRLWSDVDGLGCDGKKPQVVGTTTVMDEDLVTALVMCCLFQISNKHCDAHMFSLFVKHALLQLTFCNCCQTG